MGTEHATISLLCVDDEPGLAELTATFLERADDQLSVSTASNARDGLDHLAENEVDCIVSDFDMPHMDGLVFLQTVRAEDPDLPFILFTGRGSEGLASDAIAAGVTDYVRKQPGTEQYAILARRVRNAVSQYRSHVHAREMNHRAKTILEGSPDAIVVCVDGTFVYANPTAVELCEVDSPADILGKRMGEFVHRAHRDDVDAQVATLSSDDTTVGHIPRALLSVGDRDIPVEITARTMRWDGEPGIVAIVRDLSTEERREHEHARYQGAFEQAFDAMVIADDEGRYIEANRSACELFGVQKADLLGRRIESFAPEGFDFETAWEQFQTSERERGTFPLRRATGELRTVEYAATMNIVPGEHLSVLRDVTERENHVREVRRQKERLEEFASVVSHDLRSPLSVVRGYVELAREDGSEEYFEQIEYSLDRIDRLIDDVLWLAREGQDIGSIESVDLGSAVSDAWTVITDESTDATVVCADDVGTIVADYDRLCQLLENVLGNAIVHGGPAVTVRVEALDDGFAIEDDGPGIPESKRELVLERGYTAREDGTGFGLYIVDRVADAHGWNLLVTEGSDGGARLEFTNVDSREGR